MNIVDIREVYPGTPVESIGDTAMYLRLFYPEIVDQVLEAFTEYTDVDIIQEIVDAVGLDITCVTKNSGLDLMILGYIRGSDDS
jgi:hypothetical protein